MATSAPLFPAWEGLPTIADDVDAQMGVAPQAWMGLPTIADSLDEGIEIDPSIPGGETMAVPDSMDGGWLDEFQGLALSGALGASSGLEAAGAVLELAMPDTGEWLRSKGVSASEYLTQQMPQPYQDALNKSWLDLSGEGALRDPRAWASAAAQQLVYMIPVLGSARIAQMGITGAAKLAGKELAAGTARKGSYVAAGAGFGTGEAAAGAARAADAAGLSEEERLTAMRVAAPFGAAAGAFLGPFLERATGAGGTLGGRIGGAVVGEAGEEAGTATGTEIGKTAVGLEFDPRAIGEAAVQGAVMGAGTAAATMPQHFLAQREANAANEAQIRKAEIESARKAEVAAMLERLRRARRPCRHRTSQPPSCRRRPDP